MAGQTTDTVIDITRRFEWEVSKEQFEECEAGKYFCSPNFGVKIESQDSNWLIMMGPKFPSRTGQKNVCISLALLKGDVILKVEVEGIGIKMETGYKPGKLLKDTCGDTIISKIKTFNGRSKMEERLRLVDMGLRENILKLFKDNKITVVATLRFYVDRNDYIKKNEREKNFLTHLRTTSDLDSLADFTIICGDQEFKCHRLILASRSTVFKTMILNDNFVEHRENSITIENSSPDTVEAMLEFISKGVVPRNIENKAIDLIDLADRYDLQVSPFYLLLAVVKPIFSGFDGDLRDFPGGKPERRKRHRDAHRRKPSRAEFSAPTEDSQLRQGQGR